MFLSKKQSQAQNSFNITISWPLKLKNKESAPTLKILPATHKSAVTTIDFNRTSIDFSPGISAWGHAQIAWQLLFQAIYSYLSKLFIGALALVYSIKKN